MSPGHTPASSEQSGFRPTGSSDLLGCDWRVRGVRASRPVDACVAVAGRSPRLVASLCRYEVVAALAQRCFSNIVAIEFAYRSPILNYVPGGSNRARTAALRQQPARLFAMRLERATRESALNQPLR